MVITDLCVSCLTCLSVLDGVAKISRCHLPGATTVCCLTVMLLDVSLQVGLLVSASCANWVVT